MGDDTIRYEIPLLNIDWVEKGINKEMVKWARQFGYYLADKFEWSDWDEESFSGKKMMKEKENRGGFRRDRQQHNRNYQNQRNERVQKVPVEKKALSTTQLRKFFGEIKRIQASKYENEIEAVIMLEPKLAYAVGKEDGRGKIVDFHQQLSRALGVVESETHFNNFVNILEAVVAFHKVKEKARK